MTSRPPDPPRTPSRRHGRHRGVVAAVVAGTVALGGWGLSDLYRSDEATFASPGSGPTTSTSPVRLAAPRLWTDVGLLGYHDAELGRTLTYDDLTTDLGALVRSGAIVVNGSSIDIVADGAVIDGVDFPKNHNVRVLAANVTIRRSRVRAGPSSGHRGAIYFQNLAPESAADGTRSTVVLEDNEISGGKWGIYPSFTGVRLIARRNAVLANTVDPHTGRANKADLDVADGIDWRGSFLDIGDETMASVIEQNWIGGFVNGGAGHHYDGIVIVSGGNLVIRSNRVEAFGMTQTAAIRVATDIAPISDVMVEGNVVAGFGYGFGIGWGNPTHSDSGLLTRISLVDNLVVAGTYQSGPITAGHVDENGAPAFIDLVIERNGCVVAGDVADLHPRWQDRDHPQLVAECNDAWVG